MISWLTIGMIAFLLEYGRRRSYIFTRNAEVLRHQRENHKSIKIWGQGKMDKVFKNQNLFHHKGLDLELWFFLFQLSAQFLAKTLFLWLVILSFYC